MDHIIINWLKDPEMRHLLQWLLFMNVADVVSGLIKAYDTKSISSSVMRRGALTKIMIWIIVCVAGIISEYLKTDLTVYVIAYYLIMEGVSIFENASIFIPIPDKLKQAFNIETVDEDDKNDNEVSEANDEIMAYIKEKEKKNG